MNDKSALLYVASNIRDQLSPVPSGISLRRKIDIKDSYTKGWRVELADIRLKELRLELWFDHWANPNKRTFWYGLYTPHPSRLRPVIKHLPKYLRPRRHFSDQDMKNVGRYNYALTIPLKPGELGPPYLEEYREGETYYGKFENASPKNLEDIDRVGQRAAAFFRDVLKYRGIQSADDTNEEEAYPLENRQVVRRHLSRERNRSLATECKIRDNYRCRICSMTFEEVYGKLGQRFAEAHHIIPLHQLSTPVQSTPKNLITVCSNCHRMLHRMAGKKGDIAYLQKLMRRIA